MIKQKLPLLIAALALVGLAFGVGYVTYPLLNSHHDAIAADPHSQAQATPTVAELPASTEVIDATEAGQPDMQLFWEVWHLLERDFYGEQPNETERRYGAVRGLTETFGDRYTYFVEPQPREIEQDALRGSFGGIGAYILRSDEGFRLQPMPDQPAERAGVETDDLLVRVDEHEINLELSDDEVVSLVRGPLDTEVALTIKRSDEPEQVIPVVRAEIQTPSVEWRMLDDYAEIAAVGYIKHSLFTERSPAEMRRALDELMAEGATYLVLDLRGNPGGMLDASIEVADMWLDDGLILVEERADGTRTEFRAEAGSEANDLPTIVIVDGASASASEIVAGALQDQGQAELVGEKTFGKGSVQLIHQLSDQSSLHVTSAEWFTPGGRALSGEGLMPDLVIEPGTDPLPLAIERLTGLSVPDIDNDTGE